MIFIFVLLHFNNHFFTKLFTVKLLNNYILDNVKKRKTHIKKYKNMPKTHEFVKKYVYKRIKLKNIKFDKNCFFDESKLYKYLFPRKLFFESESVLKSLDKNFFNKIKHEKYRTTHGKIIICEIAKSYAYLSVYTNFDMVEHFRKIAKEHVFFKKEIYVLPLLVKYYLLKIVSIESQKLLAIENDILFNNIEFCEKFNNLSCASLYSVFFFNKNLINSKMSIEKAVGSANEVGLELLEIYYAIKKCFLWINIIINK